MEKGETLVDDDLRRFIIDLLDDIEDRVVAGKDAEATIRRRKPAARSPAPVGGEPAPHSGAMPADAQPSVDAAEPARPAASEPASRPWRCRHGPGGRCADSYVRVNADNLDKLLKSASELHADMLLQNLNSQEVSRLGAEIATLESQWNRTWKQIETTLRRGDRVNGSNLLAGGDPVERGRRELFG